MAKPGRSTKAKEKDINLAHLARPGVWRPGAPVLSSSLVTYDWDQVGYRRYLICLSVCFAAGTEMLVFTSRRGAARRAPQAARK